MFEYYEWVHYNAVLKWYIVWCDDNNEYEMYNNVNPQTFFLILFVWLEMRTRNCRFRGYIVLNWSN